MEQLFYLNCFSIMVEQNCFSARRQQIQPAFLFFDLY